MYSSKCAPPCNSMDDDFRSSWTGELSINQWLGHGPPIVNDPTLLSEFLD